MTTIVFQELQSCALESTLTLKLNPKSSITPDSNLSSTGWSCIQSLPNTTTSSTKSELIKDAYVRTKISPVLREMSLEMCTENLGSESGSDVSDPSIFSHGSSLEDPESPTTRKKRRSNLIFKRGSFTSQLPPPLTTITGSNCIRINPRRENGRLVMEAYSSPPIHSYVHAERSDGRLRLSIMRDAETVGDHDRDLDIDVEENKEYYNDEAEMENVEESDDVVEAMAVATVEEEEEEEVEVEQQQLRYQQESDVVYVKRGMDDIRGKMGMSGYQRRSTCKEISGRPNKIFMNWESFWVAIS